MIGYFHDTGRAGLSVSKAEAIAWYQKSAALGDKTGMLNMGVAHERGYIVAQSDTQALAWYRKSAALGNAEAKRYAQRLEAKGVR